MATPGMSLNLFNVEWEVGSFIGQGAFADVCVIRNKSTNSKLAMKVIREHERGMAYSMREVRISESLDHENVVEYYGHSILNGQLYILMELAPMTLRDLIKLERYLREPVACKYFKQLIEGISYLHSIHIAHRDLKPRNILLMSEGVLKICDFGLAVESHTPDGAVKKFTGSTGTLMYIAPESFSSEPHHAEPLDIWSAGIIMVEMLSGVRPWSEAIIDDQKFLDFSLGEPTFPFTALSQNIFNLVEVMLEVNPNDRVTCEEICTSHWYSSYEPIDTVWKTNIWKRAHQCGDEQQPCRQEKRTRRS